MYKFTIFIAMTLVAAELALIAMAILRLGNIGGTLVAAISSPMIMSFLFLSAATFVLLVMCLIMGLMKKLAMPKGSLRWIIAAIILWIPATVAMTMFSY